MKPGKSPTPRPKPDLEKLWRDLNEDPPGPISTAENETANSSKRRGRRASR